MKTSLKRVVARLTSCLPEVARHPDLDELHALLARIGIDYDRRYLTRSEGDGSAFVYFSNRYTGTKAKKALTNEFGEPKIDKMAYGEKYRWRVSSTQTIELDTKTATGILFVDSSR